MKFFKINNYKTTLFSLLFGFLSVANTAELPNFTSLIKDSAKSVVQIESINLGSVQSEEPITQDDLLRYFFENPGARSRQYNPRQQARPSKSHGSGFFMDANGYVITNAHVVRGADKIVVSTTDQKEYSAKLIGLDKKTDIALLKIEIENAPAAKIGDSDKAEIGNWVLAIGSPFGFDYTATKGIISAVSRSLPDGTYVPFIQTDAAVNPGNSGGPLYNLKGEVIGVNSQIYSNTGSFNGLAFAIPINVAINVAKQLKGQGYVSRGWLGVSIQGIDQELANSFGLDKPMGALIAGLVENGPAAKGNLKVGDIIIELNGKRLDKSSSLPPIIGSIPVNTEVKVKVIRAGKEKVLTVKIGELDEGNKTKKIITEKKQSNKGFTVSNLDKQKLEKLGLSTGVFVEKIGKGSIAEKAGFERGDIIISVDNNIVTDSTEFIGLINEIPNGKTVAVLVYRKGRNIFIPL